MTALKHININQPNISEDSRCNNNIVSVSIAPHPFAVERINCKVIAGTTILQIIEQQIADISLYNYLHVYIDGEYIERKNWHLVKPKANAIVTIRAVPQGGGGGKKNPLRTILSIAIMAGTGYIGGVLASGIGATTTFMGMNVAGLAVSGVNLLGRLVLNAIAPPSTNKFSSNKESATLFIQGAKNQAKPFARVPKVLGKHRFVPPFAALPYTELVGDDQYLRMLFVWGYGPLEISQLKIGETPIEEFDEVEIETRNGYLDDEDLTLYSNSVLQNDMQVMLREKDGFITRTTEEDADEISLDITLPNGLVEFVGSNKKTVTVIMEVQYAKVGSDEWQDAETITITAQQSSALRKGLRIKVAKGKYNVRVKRVTKDNDDNDNIFDYTIWTALRTIRYRNPLNKKGLAVTALRIKATDQLNGVIDRFNGVVEAIIPDWDKESSSWLMRKSSNPASIYRHILQGDANARPLEDERLDIEKLQQWHEHCAEHNREYNSVIDYDISVRELCADVAAAGRASPSLVDGKWSVIEDVKQSIPIQHFSPRNSFGFRGEKTFDDLPHALRVRFVNREKGWQQDERLVFDDGYSQETASKYESLEFSGVTDPEQIWRDGRYHLATARLRPETYSFYTDIEHIVCTRGDLIRFSHDVPMFGLMSARIKELTANGAILDSAVTMQTDKDYCLRIRRVDGSSVTVNLVNNNGESNQVIFTEQLEEIRAGDLVMFGEQGQESVALIVKSIIPQGELRAKITCVAYNENIFVADNKAVPEFISYVKQSISEQRLPIPKLKQIQSGREVLIRNSDGSITSRIVVTLDPPSEISQALAINAKIKASDESLYRNATIMSRSENEISIADIIDGQEYDIQLRYVATDGIMSLPLIISNHQVLGSSLLPSDVEKLEISIFGDSIYLNWQQVDDIDLSYYILRYSAKVENAAWGNAVDLVAKISKDATSVTVPMMSGSFLLKAVNVSGKESASPIIATSNIDKIYAFNAVEELIEDNLYAGGKYKTGIIDGNLTLIGQDVIEDWQLLDEIENIDIGGQGIAPQGIYYFSDIIDLEDIYTSRLSVDMEATGVDIYDLIDAYSLIDLVESWGNNIASSLFSTKVQVATSNDNIEWSDWQNLVVGDYKARAFKFRAVLESKAQSVVPLISKLRVEIDMPDRIESGDNIEAQAIENIIYFSAAFKTKPAISISTQNMRSGDYYTLSNISTYGFSICFYDKDDNLIARSFDYIAKGFGKVS